jgi:peptide/nickel transport system substrate-binding protein
MKDVQGLGSASPRLVLNRREVLAGATALGLSAFGATRAMAQTPVRGGTLRVGLIGGGASVDTLDPHAETLSPELSQSARQLSFSKLADMAPDGSFVLQLAESMEPNADATVWRIKLKSGVTFHDGSELTADDVIYTFRRILDPKNEALGQARGNIDMIDPNGLEKVDKTTVNVKLTRPWSDLISAVGQRYISIVKNGATGPWKVENFIGTGPFKLTEWVPGERYTYVRNENYFESGKPYLDGVVTLGIQDPVARVNALIAGQVDAICDVAASQAAIVQGAGLELVVNPGGGWTPLIMDTTAAPFDDVRVRKAMKLLVNREQSVEAVLQGYGSVGNDVFARWDPLYNADLPQQTFDPEKAKWLLKEAGHLDTIFKLHGSDADANMMPLALVFGQGAKQAGIKLEIQKDPTDTFWSQTYGKVPFTFSSWGYRPFFAQWMAAFVAFNDYETKWKNDVAKKAHAHVLEAASTSDPALKLQLAHEAQKLMQEDSGYIIPFFKQTIDARSKKVQGIEPHVFPYLSWYRFANAWLA